jgi:hypothetical protein
LNDGAHRASTHATRLSEFNPGYSRFPVDEREDVQLRR